MHVSETEAGILLGLSSHFTKFCHSSAPKLREVRVPYRELVGVGQPWLRAGPVQGLRIPLQVLEEAIF